MVGRHLQRKYFPVEGRVADLSFEYTPQEIDQLRARQLPEAGASIVAAKRRRLARNSWKIMLYVGPPFLLVFGLIAVTADIPTGSRWAIFLLGVGSLGVIAILGAVSRWFTHGRHTKPSSLRKFTAAALKHPDGRTVRFGGAAAAPHWEFSKADAESIDNGAEYVIYHVHDVLVYLEMAETA